MICNILYLERKIFIYLFYFELYNFFCMYFSKKIFSVYWQMFVDYIQIVFVSDKFWTLKNW